MSDRQNAATPRRPSTMLAQDVTTRAMFWIVVSSSLVYLLGQTFWYFPERGALIASLWTAAALIVGVLEYARK